MYVSSLRLAPSVAPAVRKCRVPKQSLIALIDDDESFRAALAGLLSSLGYAVRPFSGAEDLVGANRLETYGCIISDIHMPGMNGLDLQRHLIAKDCRVPVIMISARLEPGLEERATSSGAVCLLSKPFEINTLIGWLEKSMKS